MLLLTLCLLANINLVNAQTPLYDFKVTISDDIGGTQDLHFGLDATATNGFDSALGENQLPPLPPSGVFEARFIGDDIGVSELGQGTYLDYRTGDAGFSGSVEHEIKYQPGASANQVEISWNFPSGLTATIEDLFGGAAVNESLSDSGSFVITNLAVDKLKMTVTYNNVATSIEDFSHLQPGEFQLLQNYPNPFNPATQINYVLKEDSQVRLSVFNLRGQEVALLVNGLQKAGQTQLLFSRKI